MLIPDLTRVDVTQLFQQPILQTKLPQWARHPLARFILAVLFLIPVIMMNNLFSIFVLDNLNEPLLSVVQFPKSILFIYLLMVAYNQYCRRIEGREAFELSAKRWGQEFSSGFVIGSGMIAIIAGILAICGFYSIESLNSPFVLLTRIFRYGQGSFIEELLFTVILFRLLEEYAGTKLSFLTVSLIFGLMHLGNDNASLTRSAFISIQQIASLAPFILTRRIWMPWSIHFAWNYSQTAVLGLNNSGMAHQGFITPLISGPSILTGGSFGIEGSYLGLAVNLAVGVPLLIMAWRRKQFVAPSWSRNR